jgi:tripartite-type tricarboxylate transporter receptor subunit TctC
MNLRIRTATIAGASLAAAVTLTNAAGQSVPAYPVKPIRVITNSPPGAVPDVVVRIIGERLAPALDQPIVVENRVGASGTIALAAVAKARPDGYTFGTISPPHVVAPSLVPQLPYDTVRDLAPVRQNTRASFLLLVRSNSPIGSLPELVASAKGKPDRLNYASGGSGTPPHLAAELFKIQAGIQVRHIPYKGSPAAVNALLGEEVEFLFAIVSTTGTHLRAGKLRALATTGPARMAEFPEVPTLAELGLTGFDVRDWQGLVAPSGTPKRLIERFSAEVAKVLNQSDVRERLTRLGFEPVVDSDPATFGALIRSELERWTRVVREASIRID